MDGKNKIGDQAKDTLLAPDDRQDYREKRFISYRQFGILVVAPESFWQCAKLLMPQPKKGVYVRLDINILDWLKS